MPESNDRFDPGGLKLPGHLGIAGDGQLIIDARLGLDPSPLDPKAIMGHFDFF